MPASLSKLSNLRELLISNTPCTDFTMLKELPHLTRLNLSSNRIQDISFLAGMTNLTTLNLNKNQIMDISALRGMRHLKELHLMENRIVDISPLQRLTSLTGLNLIDNRVKELPEAFLNLGMEINVTMRFGLVQRIDLADNPLGKPPLEIIKKSKEVMRAYFTNTSKKRAKKTRI